MKFQEILEAHILDPSVRSARSLHTLIDNLKGKNKAEKAISLIQSYLSGIGSGNSKSVHQHGNDIQALVSAVNIYLDGDDEEKKAAIEEYSKRMSQIIKRMYN